jgi:hypothetical protein
MISIHVFSVLCDLLAATKIAHLFAGLLEDMKDSRIRNYEITCLSLNV